MHVTNLRKVGGSVMLAVPPVLLDLLHLDAGAPVGVAVDAGRLIVEPHPGPRYSLAELLAQCDLSLAADPDDNAWLGAPAVGAELL